MQSNETTDDLAALTAKIEAAKPTLIGLIPSGYSFQRREVRVQIRELGINGFIASDGLQPEAYNDGTSAGRDSLSETWSYYDGVPAHAAGPDRSRYPSAKVTTIIHGRGIKNADGLASDGDGGYDSYDYEVVTDWDAAKKALGEPFAFARNLVAAQPNDPRFFGHHLSSHVQTGLDTVLAGWRDAQNRELWAEVPPEILATIDMSGHEIRPET